MLRIREMAVCFGIAFAYHGVQLRVFYCIVIITRSYNFKQHLSIQITTLAGNFFPNKIGALNR